MSSLVLPGVVSCDAFSLSLSLSLCVCCVISSPSPPSMVHAVVLFTVHVFVCMCVLAPFLLAAVSPCLLCGAMTGLCFETWIGGE